jgi:hypothetical protein
LAASGESARSTAHNANAAIGAYMYRLSLADKAFSPLS